MGRRRRAALKERKRKIREGIEEEPEGQRRPAEEHGDAPTTVIQIQQEGQYAAAAYGRTLWLQDCKSSTLVNLPESDHTTPIRALAIDPAGKWFLAAGDDKIVKVWQLADMNLHCQWKCPKKVSAATFTHDGKHALFADKFGDVYVAATAFSEQAPQLLLGHFCSIITSLLVSPDGQYIVSTDRDHKIRVSHMPADPMQGAHEIQSYCLGHTSFVTCAAFLILPTGTVLVSGAGDGSIRAWRPETGQQLSMHTVPQKAAAEQRMGAKLSVLEESHQSDAAAEPESASAGAASSGHDASAAACANGMEEELGSSADEQDEEAVDGADAVERAVSGGGYESDNDDTDAAMQLRAQSSGQPTAAIIALAAAPNGSEIAAAVEGQDTITVLHLGEDWALAEQQQLGLPGLTQPAALQVAASLERADCAASVQFDRDGCLWVAGSSHSGDAAHLSLDIARRGSSGQEYRAVGDHERLEPLRAAMAAIQRVKQQGAQGQVHHQLRKRTYPEEEHAFRKRNRRDVREQAPEKGKGADVSPANQVA